MVSFSQSRFLAFQIAAQSLYYAFADGRVASTIDAQVQNEQFIWNLMKLVYLEQAFCLLI